MLKGLTTKYKRIYKAWQSMRARCNNPNDKDYAHYGGRGITVCNEWMHSAEPFILWALDNGYADGLSIDRIDVNKGYEPNNCRWVSWKAQERNRRTLRNNKTGHNGIHMDRGKYRATIYVNNKRIDLGRHETIEAAIEARKQGELKYWSA